MIKLIMEKELREIIGSTKFAVTFAVCSVLILLTFYVGAKNYQISLQQHRAAEAENLRQMQGLTDWTSVNSHRIFLPPTPLEVLVSGVSNDIGRTVAMAGRGELEAHDSRYGGEPILAIFRFLDLDFIFQIVLSLFAVLFAYDAINGEKERGTLKLTFANPVARDKYILGKLMGSFMAIAVPLLLPILLGSLLLPLLGVHLTLGEWLRLASIVVGGFLHLGAFLSLSVLISSFTTRSSNSFMGLLVVWVVFVLIIPRASVLMAGRAVDVPTIDEITHEKSQQQRQLWAEDRKRMAAFKPESTDLEMMAQEFQEFMNELAEERNRKMDALVRQLNEDRQNRQSVQETLAFGLARVSPTAALTLANTKLAGTSVRQKNLFLKQAHNYQKTYGAFMLEKTGMSLDRTHVIRRISSNENEQPIDPRELPPFEYAGPSIGETVGDALLDLAVLALFNIIFFAGAFVRFLKYDVR